MLDAAEKPAIEAGPQQPRPLDLEDLGGALQPAEPHGVARPRRGDRSRHVGDPSQPFDPLMRSVKVRPQIKYLLLWRPHLDNEAMVTHACSVVRPASPEAVLILPARLPLMPRSCRTAGRKQCSDPVRMMLKDVAGLLLAMHGGPPEVAWGHGGDTTAIGHNQRNSIASSCLSVSRMASRTAMSTVEISKSRSAFC
jgi:hypothetical protein